MSGNSRRDPGLVTGNIDPRIVGAIVNPHFEVNPETGRNSLLLPLSDTKIVDPRILEELSAKGFRAKTEFHVTAFDDKPGTKVALIIHGLDEARQAEIFDFIQKTAEQDQWEISPRDEFYLMEKQYEGEEVPRRSVIQMVDSPELDVFYAALNGFLPQGSEIEAPPAHITLATQGSPRGIGISKAVDIQQYGHRLETF